LVRGIERLADATETLRDLALGDHGITRDVTPTTDDTHDDDSVSYTSERSGWEREQRAERARRDGFPANADDLTPAP
jgi:hypothetical protein